MSRTIEHLIHEREKKQAEFEKKFTELAEGLDHFLEAGKSLQPLPQSDSGNDQAPESGKSSSLIKKELHRFPFKKTKGFFDSPEGRRLLQTCSRIEEAVEHHVEQTRAVLNSMKDLIRLNSELTDAKDREWDAQGSNHVGHIFKSLEWRVDRLASQTEDAALLVKTAVRLKQKLDRLLSRLEEREAPTPDQVRDILQPLEDWRYAGFENRYRGTEEAIRRQQESYLPYFETEKKVLDLGCGRGEFIGLLRDKGIEAEGVDTNDQMVEICRQKGLPCRKADILEALEGYEDGSLGGIFSSQVIEHLPPPYLRRMLDTAFSKLAPGGRIVLETINPTSVFALVQIYFLDPTHQKPIHPEALRFLLESAGYDEVEIRYGARLERERLQDLPPGEESSTIINQNTDKLNDLLFAPPNYAAIGKK